MPEYVYYDTFNKAEFDTPPYEGKPERVLIIASTQRTGSTLFASGLMEIGGIHASTEIFTPESRRDFEVRWGALSDQDYLDKLIWHRTMANGLFATKAHYKHFAPFMSYLAPYNLCFIKIQRRDIVQQAVSLFKAWITQAWIANVVPRKKLTESDYNFRAICDALTHIIRENDLWEACFMKHGRPLERIYYEDLENDYAEVIRDIANNVLGMSICTNSIPPPNLKKQSDELTEYYVSRFYADWS